MSKIRPILYTQTMVLANLAGIKSQTRRIRGEELKAINENLNYPWQISQSVNVTPDLKLFSFLYTQVWEFKCAGINTIHLTCPYGQVGDILYGRERLFMNNGEWHYYADKQPVLIDPADELEAIAWAHHKETDYCLSIHMPRFAARIWQEITSIRLERLHDITEADAIAEGCLMGADGFPLEIPHKSGIGEIGWDDAKEWYAWQWEEINGPDSWDNQNPYVWVINYKPIAKPVTLKTAKA